MPASGRVLLDTNIVIALFAGDARVRAGIVSSTLVCVPAIAMGELFYGANKSGRVDENIARLSRFAEQADVLACDTGTAAAYGVVKAALQRAGTPIPENDLWIAAVARQHELVLVTRDRHFERVAGLALQRWD